MNNLIHKIIIAFLAALLPFSFMIGMGIGTAEIEGQHCIPQGAETTGTYSYVFDGNNVIITTDTDHFIRLSDHTVIITDKELPEVEKEIRFVRILEKTR